jgi:hypothetical protein
VRTTTLGWVLAGLCLAGGVSGQQPASEADVAGMIWPGPPPEQPATAMPRDIVYRRWISDTSTPGSWSEETMELTSLVWVSQRALELLGSGRLDKIENPVEQEKLERDGLRIRQSATWLRNAASSGEVACSHQEHLRQQSAHVPSIPPTPATHYARRITAGDAVLHVRVLEVLPGLSFPMMWGEVTTGSMLIVEVVQVLRARLGIDLGQRFFTLSSFSPLTLAGEQICSSAGASLPRVGDERILAIGLHQTNMARPLDVLMSWTVKDGVLNGDGARLFPDLRTLDALKRAVARGEFVDAGTKS